MSEKKAYYAKLLGTFKDIEQKLQLGRDTPQLIAKLMSMGVFSNNIKSSNKFNTREIEQLKDATAPFNLVIGAKNVIYPFIGKVIPELERALKGPGAQDDEMGGVSNLMGQMKPSEQSPTDKTTLDSRDKEEPKKTGLFTKSEAPVDSSNLQNVREFYCSYFSDYALKQIAEHLHSGVVPPAVKRHITVCFIDLVGFSRLAEYAKTEQIVEVLNIFFNQVNSTIRSYGGDIDKFIGDALLVIFDNAENAVRCGLEILTKDLDIINLKLDYMEIPDVMIHFGLNTGWVVQAYVGSRDRRETTVVGDGVNIASRVQSISPPNQLWITASTLAALGSLQKRFKQVGRRKLKGRSNEVMIYNYVRKIPADHLVVLYEPDKTIYTEIVKEMGQLDIKNIIHAIRVDQMAKLVLDNPVQAIVVGPSIDPVSYKEVIDVAEKKKEGGIPIIPIIRKQMDADTWRKLEEMNLHLYVPLYKERGMEKLLNVLINQSVKAVPRKIEEEKPEEPDSKEKKPVATVMESGEREKISISVNETDVNLVINAVLNRDEMRELKKDLAKLWQYSMQQNHMTFTIELSAVGKDKITSAFLSQLLSVFDFDPDPEKVKIKVDFGGDKQTTGWEEIKNSFQYQFLS